MQTSPRRLIAWLFLCGSAWARPDALTVQVDLNRANLARPLKPHHEIAFQLEAHPPGQGGAPGGVVHVYRIEHGQERLVDALSRKPDKPDPALTVKATGYLYRQLFIWPNWRKAGPGEYLARYQQDPKLAVRFRL